MMDFLLLKALHSTLGLTITICDKNFTVVTSYQSDKTISLYYNHYLILNGFSETQDNFLFHYGFLGELFLAYRTKQHYIILGPWRSNAIDPLLFKKKLADAKISELEQNYFFDKLAQLPFFSLSQVRELLILVNYCLTGTVQDKLSDPLHTYTESWSQTFEMEKIRHFSEENYSSFAYQYHYENSILKAVKTGDEAILKDTINRLSGAVFPSISGDELRSEKNYSIIVYDRLAQGAIQSGLDIETAYQARDRFIKETEVAQTLTMVLKLRDTAILFYTQQIAAINKKMVSSQSQTVIAVTQYLKNNLNRSIKMEELAKQFHMSESKLRKLFKQETHVTIQQYFLNLKIDATKQLLKEGKRVEEITRIFGFSSSSNFSRTFKKLVGISPREYVRTTSLGTSEAK
ncbi:YSIRK-targeted surface antigen transcriptional regulator [Streptococcus phocae subsp. salmonis]|uniref:YSIRK-targeted surface antigen transcriptional regulator n=1 Tax=Streptococcus phocae TaxID=119224 RepID=UPI00053140EA|nr:YSIRK-targeted surface antigen transcriptional regulator [Streptococcus phocae]KGR72759.1 AraC family transcriptional regulator [Streptococcus phocae subsp. salmonis]